MDYQTEFNPDLASTLKAAISGMWSDAHIASRLPSPPVLTALESENYQSPVEPLSNGCDGFTTLETVPYNFDQSGPSFTDGFMEQAAPFVYQEPVFGENGMWSVCPRSPFGVYNQAQVRYQVKCCVRSCRYSFNVACNMLIICNIYICLHDEIGKHINAAFSRDSTAASVIYCLFVSPVQQCDPTP